MAEKNQEPTMKVFFDKLEETKIKTDNLIAEDVKIPVDPASNMPAYEFLPQQEHTAILELERTLKQSYTEMEEDFRHYSREMSWIEELQQSSIEKAYDIQIAQQDVEAACSRLNIHQEEANALNTRITDHAEELEKSKLAIYEKYQEWQINYQNLMNKKNDPTIKIKDPFLKGKLKFLNMDGFTDGEDFDLEIDEENPTEQAPTIVDDIDFPKPRLRTTEELRELRKGHKNLDKLKDIAFLQTQNNTGEALKEPFMPDSEELAKIVFKAIDIIKPVEISDDEIRALSKAEQEAYYRDMAQLEQQRRIAMEQAQAQVKTKSKKTTNDLQIPEPDLIVQDNFWGEAPATNKKRLIKYQLLSYVLSIILALVAAFLIREYCFQITKISGDSMNNTLTSGDRVLTSSISYYFGNTPQRGDIVIFPAPDRADAAPYIKRVIALPGEKIAITGGLVYINDNVLKEDYLDEVVTLGDIDTIVPDGMVFVMGDNRTVSHDSRSPNVSFIRISDIESKATWRIYPFDRLGSIYE